MWVVFAIIVAALIAYASAKVPMEVTSIGVICALMLFFQLAPVDGDYERLSPARILQGFANPALITVLSLLVMGEGIARTGILDQAAVGLVYLLFVAPRLLPERTGFTDELIDRSGTQFIAQLTISSDSELIGEQAPAGMFVGLPNMTVRLVQREEDAILPPFENLALQAGDVIVVAATRKTLTDALARDPGLLFPLLQDGGEEGSPLDDHVDDQDHDDSEPWRDGEQVLAEAMVTPSSRLIGHTLTRIKFRYRTGCILLGIQRRARMFRTRHTDIRLEVGDVLLLQGRPEAVARLRGNGDVLLIEWSQEDLPALGHARRASCVFVGMLALAAFEILPIVTATLTGAWCRVDGDGRCRLCRKRFRRGHARLKPAGDAVHFFHPAGGAFQHHQHPDDGGVVYAHCGRYCVADGCRAANLCGRRHLRRQLFVCLADRLSDQFAGDGAGALPFRRFRQGWRAVDRRALGRLQSFCALVLRALGPLFPQMICQCESDAVPHCRFRRVVIYTEANASCAIAGQHVGV